MFIKILLISFFVLQVFSLGCAISVHGNPKKGNYGLFEVIMSLLFAVLFGYAALTLD